MQRNKVFSIISIVCLASIVFIPIGLALMWFTTEWKKKLKIILTGSLSLLYVGIFAFILLFEPSVNTSGTALPFNYSKGHTEFNTNIPSGGKQVEELEEENKTKSKKKSDKKADKDNAEKVPYRLKKQKGQGNGRLVFSMLFFFIMLALIILQNLRSKKKQGYENPYVDTNQYKLPLKDDAKMPMVHFLKLRLNSEERINFATETNQKNNEGNLVITNQRVVIMNIENGFVEFPLEVLEAVSSVSNTVMMLTSGTRKYYIFLPESQMKYALAVLRWSFKKRTENI